MILSKLSVSTHIDHLFHPFSEEVGFSETTTTQRVIGIALFVFSTLLTLGISCIFYVYYADKKIELKLLKIKTKEQEENDDVLRKQEISKNLETVMQKVQDAALNGERLALFIGRRNDQSVPQNDGYKWFTLDVEIVGNPKINQTHLCMDFNNYELIEKLSALFNKVVLDFSTLKFFHSNRPWKLLKSLLKPLETSALITEVSKGCHSISPNFYAKVSESELKSLFKYEAPSGHMTIPGNIFLEDMNAKRKAFDIWKKTDEKESRRLFDDFRRKYINEISKIGQPINEANLEAQFSHQMHSEGKYLYQSPQDRAIEIFDDAVEDYLKTLFKKVKKVKGPYPGRFECDQKVEYFKMKAPKNAQEN